MNEGETVVSVLAYSDTITEQLQWCVVGSRHLTYKDSSIMFILHIQSEDHTGPGPSPDTWLCRSTK